MGITPASDNSHSRNIIELAIDTTLNGDEHYQLTVDKKGISIKGRTEKAIFWGIQTLDQILLGDIVARNNIRNGNAIRLLAKKLAECVMQPTTQTRLLHIVKSSGNAVGRNTIADFLGYMNDAYLTFDIANYIDSLAERASNCKRYYFDNALLNNFLVEAEPQLLENIVAIDLVKRYRESESDGVYFYNKGIEVDFYVPNEKMAIQVSYSISDSITREREIRALVKLASVFDVANAIIITRHEESVIEQDGMRIDVIPIHKWLLRV
jgi:predicted AAA+ superfamily ATPase